jgi:uncharacterized Tic20 family protein
MLGKKNENRPIWFMEGPSMVWLSSKEEYSLLDSSTRQASNWPEAL